MNRRLYATLLLGCMVAPRAVGAAPEVPLYPGSDRQPFPESPPGRATAMVTAPGTPAVVGAWYVAELRKRGWSILNSRETPGRDGSAFSLTASYPEPKWRLTISAVPRAGKSQCVIALTGEGVTASSIAGEPKPFELPKPTKKPGGQGPTSPGGAGVGGAQPLPEDRLPDATGAWADLGTAYDAMVTALERFCAQPSVQTATSATKAIGAYVQSSVTVKEHAAGSLKNRGNVYAAFTIFAGSNVEFDVAMLGALIEEGAKTPARLPELARRIKPTVEKMRNRIRKAAVTSAQYASAADVKTPEGAKDPGAPAHEPTKQQYRELGMEPPEPETTVVVTRVWTPSHDFWAKQLKDTFVALRCWNSGCPEGCIRPTVRANVEYDGECKAFGTWPFGAEESDPHCLQLTRTRERELDLLSRKLTVYGLVALDVEVGDPDQLKGGGELRVWINNEYLGATPLPAAGKPARNANPWDYAAWWAGQGYGSGATFTLGAEKQYRGIRAVYGKEAAEAFRTASRMESAVMACSGGEIDGYSRFLHIGVPAMDARSDSILIGIGGSDLFGLTNKLRKIAEKAHPALQANHTVRIQAVVGGVDSEPVDFEIAGPFKSLPDAAGTFSGWPGGAPKGWEFGGALGTLPEPDTPAVLPISDMRTMLTRANRRFAMMCATAVLKVWYENLRDLAAGSIIEHLTPAVPENARNAIEQCFRGTDGALNLRKAYSSLGKIVSNFVPATVEWIQSSLQDDLGNSVGKLIDKGMGDDYFQQAETFANRISVYGTPSYQVLTWDAQARITRLRDAMWRMARYAQEEADIWNELDEFADNIITLGGWVKGTKFVAAWELPARTFLGTGWAGIAVSHLNQIRMIVQNYQEIAKILEDEKNWRTARVP